MGALAAGSSKLGQFEALERQVTALKEQLADVGTTLKKLVIRPFQMEADL